MESNHGSGRPRIQRLSGPNYRNWALQIRVELEYRKAWSAIDPTYTLEIDLDAVEKEESEERKILRKEQETSFRNTTARKIILEYCTQTVIDRVISIKSAKELWEHLILLYAREGRQQLMSKSKAFTSYQPPATMSVYDVSKMLDNLQDDITAIKPENRPDDSVKAERLLEIMEDRGGDYRMASMQAVMSNVTDYTNIVTFFLDMEEKIKLRKAPTESARQASTGSDNTSGRGNGRGRGGGRNGRGRNQTSSHACYHCGKTGHIQKNCFSKKRGEPKATSPSTGPLAAPGGGQGLSPQPEANVAVARPVDPTSTSWIAVVDDGNTDTANWLRSENPQEIGRAHV